MKITEPHRQLIDSLEKFIAREIDPHIDAWEEAEIFPARELFRKMGAQGFLGATKPEAYGGLGLDYSFSIVSAETLGTIRCGGVPLAIGVQTDMATPALAKFGSRELCEEFLVPAISGEAVAAIGVSEPGAGSDVAGIKTQARADGDDYVISGSKLWITNGIQADWVCLLANTSDGKPHQNKSLICVPMDLPGIETRKIRKLGMWSSDTAEIFFDEVRVPKRYRIGSEGSGFMYQMIQFQEERMWGAASLLRTMEDLLAETREYAGTRQAFGQTILDFQTVHFRLAELETEVELLRSLIYRGCDLYVEGENILRMAAMMKLKAGRLVREVTDSCLQYWGGMGYVWDSHVARAFRDARLVSIGGGADEVMLSIICKLNGTLPSKRRR